jgi:hypothetical protein
MISLQAFCFTTILAIWELLYAFDNIKLKYFNITEHKVYQHLSIVYKIAVLLVPVTNTPVLLKYSRCSINNVFNKQKQANR